MTILDRSLYAYFSNDAYIASANNAISVPDGWERKADLSNTGEQGALGEGSVLGFAANVYVNSTNTEAVIAFRGTEPTSIFNVVTDVVVTDLLLGVGLGVPQVTEAVSRYVSLMALYPHIEPENITFTGHSLGGGLAALMAIAFDHHAETFAPAPFAADMFTGATLGIFKLVIENAQIGQSNPDVLQRLQQAEQRLDDLIADVGGHGIGDGSLYQTRKDQNVIANSVEGEFLSAQPGLFELLTLRVASDANWKSYDVGDSEIGGVGRHSMILHAACVASPAFTAACRDNPEFLAVLADGSYFPTTADKSGHVPLLQILRQHYVETDYGGGVGEGALDRLAYDVAALASLSGQPEGRTELLINGLNALAIQYHMEWAIIKQSSGHLFQSVNGGIQFDVNEIVSLTQKAPIGLRDGTGWWVFGDRTGELLSFLKQNTLDSAGASDGVRRWKDVKDYAQWFVATGPSFISYGSDQGDVIIGSASDTVDELHGSAGDDLIVGQEGSDIIDGGVGDDRLYGGDGLDVYEFSAGHGVDNIFDGSESSENGEIRLDGRTLSGGYRLLAMPGSDSLFWRDNDNASVIYEFQVLREEEDTTGQKFGTLIIYTNGLAGSDRIYVHNFVLDRQDQDGSFGLTFHEQPRMAVQAGITPKNPFSDPTYVPPSGGTTGLAEGGSGAYTLALNSVADVDRTVTLSAAGATGLAVVTGDDTIPFAGGTVTITIPAGQSMVTFGLLQLGDVDANETIQFTATLPGIDGAADISTGLTLTINAAVEGDIDGVHLEGNTATTVLQGGVTNDLIEGHKSTTGGTYNLYGMGGDDLIYADDAMDETQLLAQLETQAATSYQAPYQLDAWEVDLHGGGGNDKVFGNGDGEQIAGGDGNDLLAGGGGNDVLLGDTLNENTGGADRLYGGSGNDLLSGEEGADVLHGGIGNDFLYGGRDADMLLGGDDDDLLLGDTEYNVVTFGGQVVLQLAADANDFLDGGAGNDRLSGGGGDDALFGGAGNDLLKGGSLLEFPQVDPDGNDITVTSTQYDTRFASDNDYLDGEGGDDQLEGGVGDDLLLGGEGNDLLSGDYADSAPEYQGNDTLYGEAGNDQLLGYGGDDALDGGDGIDLAVGGNGRDYIAGGAGDDHLEGGAGEDRIFGGDGNDTLYGDHDSVLAPDAVAISLTDGDADYLDGGAGNDVINGQGGDDEILGGAGADQLTGSAGNDTIYGGSGSDVIRGDASAVQLDIALHGDDYIDAGADDDSVFAGGGNDVVYGGDGADTLAGEAGNDTLYGGIGNDTLHGDAADVALEAQGADELYGEAGADYLVGYGGDDILDGGDDDDEIYGMEGADTLVGGAGNDILYGNEGNDVIAAGDGNDQIQGGTGDDTLDGGIGDDVYYIAANEGVDHIIDAGGADTLALDGVSPSDIRFDVGSLKITFASGSTSEIHIEGFNPSDISSSPIETIAFANGSGGYTAISVADLLLMQGFDIGGEGYISGTELGDRITGSDSADFILAQQGADTVSAGAGDDVVLGDNGDDRIYGEAGNDYLDGGLGADIMVGGAGDDIYQFDGTISIYAINADGSTSFQGNVSPERYVKPSGIEGVDYLLVREKATEALNGGYDTLYSTAGSTLLDGNVEELHLVGANSTTAFGNYVANSIYGNALDNEIVASSAWDESDIRWSGGRVVGVNGGEYDYVWGGAGNDTIGSDSRFSYGSTFEGGTGDDTYYAMWGDQVIEQVNEGTDTVILGGANGDYWLSANVENLQVRARTAGLGDVHGNELDNLITGASQNGNTYGEDGNDTMLGGMPAAVPSLGYVYYSRAVMFGGNGDDTLLGGHQLLGDAGNDYLEGGWLLDGGTGADLMVNGQIYYVDDANDQVIDVNLGVDDGRDEVRATLSSWALGENLEILRFLDPADAIGYGNELANFIYGNAGNDQLSGAGGNDRLEGAAGDDVLVGGTGVDVLLAGDGTDVLHGDEDNDQLFGEAGNDVLHGGAGNDLLDGGAGSDAMHGGSGDDVYMVESAGDTVIEDIVDSGGVDEIRSSIDWTLGAGDGVENLALVGSALFGQGNELGNRIDGTAGDNDLRGMDGDDVLSGYQGDDTMSGGAGNDTLLGDDGADVLDGGDGDDVLQGGGWNDVLQGGAGNDLLQGGTWNDVLYGGAGNDVLDGGDGTNALYGGSGDDQFVIAAMYSNETSDIYDDGGVDSLVLAGSMTIDRLEFSLQGSDLHLTDTWSDYHYVLHGWANQETRIEYLHDGNGVVDIVEYMASLPPPSGSLVVASEDDVFPLTGTLPMPTLTGMFPGFQPMSVSPTLQQGAYGSLQLSLSLNYVYTPTFNVQALAAGQMVGDAFNYSLLYPLPPPDNEVDEMVTFRILGANDAPVLVTATPDQWVDEDANFLFAIPEGTFRDIDNGDVLTLSASMADGSPLPSWLSFDAATNTFAGIPANVDVGAISLRVMATDSSGASAHADFLLTVNNVNDAPQAQGEYLVLGEDSALLSVSAASLLANDSDIDAGDVLSVSAVDAVSAQGVAVSLANGEVGYDAGSAFNALREGEVLVDTFGYAVSDLSGAVSMATVSVEIIGANDAPILVAPVADQGVAGGTAFTFAVPAGTFTDVDNNDVLALSATLADGSALPAWLVFDAATGTFSGTAPVTAEVIALNVAATDLYGASATDQFVLTVTAAVTEGGHGNEGVGNGQDAPPPGHDNNQNDGPGTSPGNPGNAHHNNPHARYGWQSAPGAVSSWDLLEGLLQFQLDGFTVESDAADTLAARATTDGLLSVDDQLAQLRRASEASRRAA